jgi:membrane fusion protein (multidrug efflux system)
MPRHHLLAVLLASLLVACGKGGNPEAAAKPDKSDKPVQALLIAPEDLRTLRLSNQAQGAVITGTIQPERRADLRAEVSAVVLQVLKENGESVKRGDLLIRLDDTAIRDSLASAQESARASSQAFEQAERQVQRLKTLQGQGMTSMQALEDAEVRRNTAQSDLAAAKSRVVSARQMLQRTEVRAPFDGMVSERKASAGDTAQVGKELVKVIDPASMRFQGLVSADRMPEIRIGQAVSFRVNGFPQTDFSGKIKRVDAAANATTRQVEVLVEFADGSAPRMSGLYAEGRIASTATQALMVPESSVVKVGDSAYAWRVKDKTLAKVPVQLGERDARRGEYLLRGGLADGDQILRNPSGTLTDGQKVEFAAVAASSAALAASRPAPTASAASAGR